MEEQQLSRLAKMLKALGHPLRLKLYLEFLDYVRTNGSLECSDDGDPSWRSYAEDAGIAPSTLSQHLKELSNAELIHVRRSGKRTVAIFSEEGAAAVRVLLARLPPQ